MLVLFAGDHAGFELKGKLIEFVRSLGHEAEDMGPHSYDAGDDYVDFVVPLARKVAEKSKRSDLSPDPGSDLDAPHPNRECRGGGGARP